MYALTYCCCEGPSSDDLGPRGEVGERVARVADLVEADDAGGLPFALAASAEVESQGDVAGLGQEVGGDGGALSALMRAEAV